MNSGPNVDHTRINWILTTCRGRVSHLRESLPSWLDWLPSWSPLVVCCDDREAYDYAAGELRLAGRGAAVYVEQGPYFSRLEAIRSGVRALLCGVQSVGGAWTASELEPHYYEPTTIRGQVALFDADTVAIRTTAAALTRVGRYDAGVVVGGIRDDMGFLMCHGDALRSALDAIPAGMFSGYGFEDCALRVGVWRATGGKFVGVPPCWARKIHTDRERAANHAAPISQTSTANGVALGRLIADTIQPSDWEACAAACLPGQKVRICKP